MTRWFLKLLAFFAALSSACATDLSLTVPPGEWITVSQLGESRTYSLKPEDAPYRTFNMWLTKNQKSWSSLYYTPPSKGILVYAGGLRIQFVDSVAIAHTREGMFDKAVSEAEYSYLRQ